MSSLQTLNNNEYGIISRGKINDNFTALNTDKMEKSGGTFTSDISVPDEAYGVGWNGSTEVPTKNALYDKIETLGSVATDTIWDAKGDLAVGTGSNTASRLAIGTNGQVLTVDSAEATGTKWATISGTGDVVGPASSTDNAIARFDSTTGKLIQNGVITESDNGDFANVNAIQLDTTPTSVPTGEGILSWNSTEKTLDIQTGLSTHTLQVGREHGIYVTNNTGSTISNGSVVYILSSSGSNPTIALAQANDYTKSVKTIGVATMDIANGASGIVTTYGMVRDLNTSGFSIGDTLYLSNSVSGGIQNTNPTGLNYTLELGICITSHATTGIILVDPKVLRAIESDEFKIVDSTDKTKQASFVVSGITSGTKRQYTLPNSDTTLVGLTTTDTLTNKSISLGTNTVTATKAQLDTAVTDGNIVYVSDSPTLGTITTTGSIELGHATDTTISRVSAGVVAVEGVTIPTISSTSTFTNKRVSKRVVVTTQSATPTINTDNGDIFQITGLAQAITSMTTNLTGTPVAGDMIMIQITDNGTARAITWGASFASTTITLPTTTVISTMLRVGFQRNNANTAWDCVFSI